ncbi:kinase-like domain-containing protein [Glomus cerebriforme]|uniref:Kinase-like domain-containing protein n=1 Tax=Glomus cerebriforme TaxID=658196 RepID=A0A397SXE4_9GLOM|nr:kinase-like domain-containing protein [Glomus cerebriforme]
MVLEYAKDGNFNDWINENYEKFDWSNKILVLRYIISGLVEIHQKQMVHRDLHTGNILFGQDGVYVSDIWGDDSKVDGNIYGIMPYVAPEVLRGKPYTQAADIYSFGMIMYFAATGRQPFDRYAHDQDLVLSICKGASPKIYEQEAPKCYVDLMKKCWDLNPDNRPDAIEIKKTIELFYYSYIDFIKKEKDYEIEKQFKEIEKYKKELSSTKLIVPPQAFYKTRLINTQHIPQLLDAPLNNSDELVFDFSSLEK